MLLMKKLRLQRGWSQAELAQFSGLSVRTIQRVEKGHPPGLETLKSLAAVFDLDVADLQPKEAQMDEKGISLEEKKAFKDVQELKGFYTHLMIYLVVMAGLFTVNLLSNPDYIWARWPALGWGVGVVINAVQVFGRFTIFGPEWEKRQVEKRLGRKL